MFTTLYFYFCVLYSVLITKNLVSICHHSADPFTAPPQTPSGIHYSILYIYVFVVIWFGNLFCLFLCFLYFTWVKANSICLSPTDLFLLA